MAGTGPGLPDEITALAREVCSRIDYESSRVDYQSHVATADKLVELMRLVVRDEFERVMRGIATQRLFVGKDPP